MGAKLGIASIGISSIAFAVAFFDVRPEVVKRWLTGESSPAAGAAASRETVQTRIATLERENAELLEQLQSAQARLAAVESANTETEERMVRLELTEAESRRSLARMQSSVSTLESTRTGAAKDETETEDTPKLEDYIRIDTNSIAGLPGPHVIVEGANLHVRSGSGATGDLGGVLLGLGNVVVGYNEENASRVQLRTGSHNLVVGGGHGFTSFGGLVAGLGNEVSAPGASVTGGRDNAARGFASSVSGGENNEAEGSLATVTGGANNQALGEFASVTGGSTNTATGVASAVTGGERNIANGELSSVAGGSSNQTIATITSIAGGIGRLEGDPGWTSAGAVRAPPM
jgi:hypothetical protein